jgi:hypothetical protein
MKKFLLMIFVMSGFMTHEMFSQPVSKFNLGLGAGLDYGGFGAQLSYIPVNWAVVFGSAGYNLNAAGYNLGVKVSYPSESRVEGHLTGMYGYNAVLIVKSGSTGSVTYYGPTVGAGMILKSKNRAGRFWSFELLLPFRAKEFHDAIDSLDQLGYDINEPLPLGFSVGYHFSIF